MISENKRDGTITTTKQHFCFFLFVRIRSEPVPPQTRYVANQVFWLVRWCAHFPEHIETDLGTCAQIFVKLCTASCRYMSALRLYPEI